MLIRHSRGNTLAMVAAVTVIGLLVIIFALLYMSMVRSGTEHKTAIESAAIAAAKDISRIVVDSPECGLVGLTNQAAIYSDTTAPDEYYQEVHSINELIATARLGFILANEIGDADGFLKALAQQDLDNAKAANAELTAELQAALAGGTTSKDSAGNTVTPYASAQAAYMKNQAKGSSYVANSLVLTLGGIQGGMPTSTKVPQPMSKGAVAGKEAEGFYMSDTNIPYNGTDFVFGSVTKRVSLCTVNNFQTNIAGLPYQVPSVVRAQARQQFQDQGKTWQVDYAACASAGSVEPQRPAPGALTFSFPDGGLPELSKPGDVIGYNGMAACTMDLYTSVDGDFILEPGSSLEVYPYTVPFINNPPTAAECAKLALHDWLRCGGSKVNIDEVLNMLNTDWANQGPDILWRAMDPEHPPALLTIGNIPRGIMHIYTIEQDGSITYKHVEIKPSPYTCVGEGQLYAEINEGQSVPSKVALWKLNGVKYPDVNGNLQVGNIAGLQAFDVYVRDQARNIGDVRGGQHAGDRMDGNPQISFNSDRRHDFDDASPWGVYTDYGRGAFAGGEANHGNGNNGHHNGHHSNNGGSHGNNGNHGGNNNGHNGTSGNGHHSGSHASASGTTGSGEGIPPMITRQDDFASSNLPLPDYVSYTYGSGGQPRPAYTKNGLAADIRFRRQLDAGDLDFLIGGHDLGYVGEMW